jgi:hypothetical protein
MTWDTLIPLPVQWIGLDEIKTFREELIELINLNFSNHKAWAWKDPRTAILLPIWKDVLDEMGIALSVIFVIRNPIDVAKSLKNRDGFSYDKSFGIWLNQNLAALQAIFDLPHFFIHYDSVLDDWDPQLKRCTSALNINWPKDELRLRVKMNEFLQPDLRHSSSETMELKKANAHSLVVELYELLKKKAETSLPADAEFIAKIENFSSEFLSYARFYQYDSKQWWYFDRRLAEKERLLAEKEHLLAENEIQIQRMLNSWSWKLTKPLRGVYWMIKRKRISFKP